MHETFLPETLPSRQRRSRLLLAALAQKPDGHGIARLQCV
jgi:hypothetical protein